MNLHNCGGKVIKVFLNKQRKKNSMGQLVLRGARDSERRAPSRSINASACHPTVPQITSVRSVAYLPRSAFRLLPLPRPAPPHVLQAHCLSRSNRANHGISEVSLLWVGRPPSRPCHLQHPAMERGKSVVLTLGSSSIFNLL